MTIEARGTRTATAPSTLTEQSLTEFLHVEIMRDLDDGRLTFIASAEQSLGDLREISPARFLGMVAEARTQLDAMERLARVFEAEDTLAAILTEHGLTLEEVDPAGVAEHFGDVAPNLGCWAGKENGRLIVWVPAGQDPIRRVNAIAALVNDPDSVVREG